MIKASPIKNKLHVLSPRVVRGTISLVNPKWDQYGTHCEKVGQILMLVNKEGNKKAIFCRLPRKKNHHSSSSGDKINSKTFCHHQDVFGVGKKLVFKGITQTFNRLMMSLTNFD